MELTFEKVGNQYVAEFQAPSDFNLHIEREEIGVLEVHQRGSEEGKYDFAWSTGVSGRKVVDYDFGALVYPKWIKVVSGSEVVKAFVTCSNGEATQIEGSKYEFVDLGLPSGTKWATCNVGATKPEEIGLFFQWGDTQGYKVTLGDAQDESNNIYSISSMEPKMKQFASSDYKFYNTENGSFTKYNDLVGLTTLELSDDAANANYSKMRMPTKEECAELFNGTIYAWTDNYNGTNVKGCIFTSKIDETKSIFIPAAGTIYDGVANAVGFGTNLWSSSLSESSVEYAYLPGFFSGGSEIDYTSRFIGASVRGVLIN